MKKQWYCLAVQTQKEGSVKKKILKESKIKMMEDSIGRVLIPTTKILRMDSTGRRRIDEQKKFVGYVIVEADITDVNVYNLINDTPEVFGFLPLGATPSPLTKEEINPILEGETARTKRKRAEKIEVVFNYSVGDDVIVVEGSFQGVVGKLLDIDEPYPRAVPQVTVEIEILGKKHPLVLDYWKVKRA